MRLPIPRHFTPTWQVISLIALSLGVQFFFLYSAAQVVGEWGIFPLDDSYIHLRIVDNWLQGRGMCINPGEVALPESAILWALVLMALGLITTPLGLPLEVLSLGLGMLFHTGSVLLVWMIVRQLTRDSLLGWLTALTLIITGRFTWAGLSGMELTLACFLALLVIHLDSKDPNRSFSWKVGVVGGLASLARPELALLVAVIAFVRGFRPLRWGPWLEASIAAVFFLLYPAYMLIRTGDPFPSTLVARMQFSHSEPILFFDEFMTFSMIAENSLLWGGALIFGILLMSLSPHRWQHMPLWAWPLANLFVLAFYLPSTVHHQRYLLPMLPVVITGLGASIPWSLKPLKARAFIAGRIAMLAVIICGAFVISRWHMLYTLNCDNIFDQQITVSRWINDNLPEDALLAINDIGAMTYYTDRRIYDLAGLANPESLGAYENAHRYVGVDDDFLIERILEAGCTHAIFYPNWFNGFLGRADVFELREVFALELNSICGGPVVVVCNILPQEPAAESL